MDRDAEATQAVFRRANEGISAFAREMFDDGPDALAPFLCECPDRRCTHVVRLTPAEFEAASSVEGRFVVLPGHEGRMLGGDVIERSDRFTLVSRALQEHSRS